TKNVKESNVLPGSITSYLNDRRFDVNNHPIRWDGNLLLKNMTGFFTVILNPQFHPLILGVNTGNFWVDETESIRYNLYVDSPLACKKIYSYKLASRLKSGANKKI